MEISKRLDNFELKLRQLASKFERQQTENEALADENATLKRELDRQRGVVSSLKEKLEQTARSVSAAGGEEVSSAKADPAGQVTRDRIDACIRELEVCIAWLEKH